MAQDRRSKPGGRGTAQGERNSETAKQRNNVSLSYLGRDSEWKTKLLYTLALGPFLVLSR